MRVAHIITDLFTGGAETMLAKLLCATDRARFESTVIALTGAGEIGDCLRAQGIPVVTLGMRHGTAGAGALRLARVLRRLRPHLVQTWMYHADLLGGLAARSLGGVPIVWNIRCGRLDRALNRRATLWTARACAALSRVLPSRIVCCSEAAVAAHAAAGYARSRMQVIPNGFDLAAFRPEPRFRAEVREELGIPQDAPLAGLLARFDAAKDHATFCAAAGIAGRARPDLHLLLCGAGTSWSNPELASHIERAEIGGRCHLLGPRRDVPRLMAALDVAVSSSVVEGFPNVVGEAMACGVPCVVTDAGDSRLIVGETGEVAPPRQPEALAAAMVKLFGYSAGRRAALGAAARERVRERFSLPAVVRQYESLYEELALCAA